MRHPVDENAERYSTFFVSPSKQHYVIKLVEFSVTLSVLTIQGCWRISLAEYLCNGSTTKDQDISSLAVYEMSSQSGLLNSNSPDKIWSNNSSWLLVLLENGGNPHSKMYNITPTAHTSTLSKRNAVIRGIIVKHNTLTPYPVSERISGAT